MCFTGARKKAERSADDDLKSTASVTAGTVAGSRGALGFYRVFLVLFSMIDRTEC